MAIFPFRRKWVVLVLLIAVAGIAAKFVALLVSGPSITISKETTFITGPLHPDGFPDYVGALNQRQSEGVTPENNSAVLFWRAVGPGEIDAGQRERFFQMLGIPQPPENGDYFVASETPMQTVIAREIGAIQPAGDLSESEIRDRCWEQINSAMRRPWAKEEFPVWAEWIAANEKPLELLIESSKRPRRYDPLIGDSVINVTQWSMQGNRDAARALVARAMLRLNEGKLEDAWRDLSACHRLARLAGQGPTLVEAMVAVTIEGMACDGDRALLEHGKLPPARIAEMRKELADLPPMPDMADKIDVAERFLYLDAITAMARLGPEAAADGGAAPVGQNEPASIFDSLKKSMRLAGLDWELMLRMANASYDRAVEACRKPTRAERMTALHKLNEELDDAIKHSRNWKNIVFSAIKEPRRARSRMIGQILISLMRPSCQVCVDSQDRTHMRTALNDLAFALAIYRAEHGAYPAKLGELAPKYVDELPKDIFTNGADLRYSREEGGYLLYSVGPNGKDDGGKGRDDRQENRDCDDIVVRIAETGVIRPL